MPTNDQPSNDQPTNDPPTNDQPFSNQSSSNQPSSNPSSSDQPSGRHVIPLSPQRQAALPLSSRSPAAWATALVDLGDPRHALVEIATSGVVRWWSPQPGGPSDHNRLALPDALDLVWCRRAAPDIEVVALVVGTMAASGPDHLMRSGDHPLTAAVAATRCGEYAVTVGNWSQGSTEVAGRGTAVDAVLLYLGLSTAPEARTPADLLCSMWADRLLAAAALHPGSITTWVAAARRHPLGAAAPTPPQLGAATHDLAHFGWDRIRLAVGGGRAEWAELNPATARWMDRGAFARWLLDRYPDLDDQRLALRAVLPSKLAAAVERTIAASLG